MANRIGKAVKIYTYARTVNSKSEYADKMGRLSKQIFGEVARPTSQEGMNVVKRLSEEPHDLKQYRVEYYPAIEETTELFSVLRSYGLFRDEHEDFKEEMRRVRARRGKERVRNCWPDGKRPEKVVELRYDD